MMVKRIWTFQLSHWRSLTIPYVDTTVKTGLHAFAPTWDMVLGVKSKNLSEEHYRALYIDLLRQSWKVNRLEWENILNLEEFALGCYCKPGEFCHRHILKEAIIKIYEQRNIEVIDCGEFTKPL